MIPRHAWPKVKRCSHEGCTDQVVQGGVCYRHGNKTPQFAYKN